MSSPAVVLGDIGGTNTRLGLAVGGRPAQVRRYLNSAYGSLDACLSDFLGANAIDARDARLHLALAAPTDAQSVRLTNCAWTVSAADLAARFGFSEVILQNDFAALAMSMPAMEAGDRVLICQGKASTAHPSLFLGAGTGFGASLRLPSGEIVASEAGHALMAPVTEAEAAVLERLRSGTGAVSVEDVCSGRGLSNLYRAVARVPQTDLTAEEVTRLALIERDDFARQALGLFFSFLGTAARNLALSTGARGGVYIAGGIVPRFEAALRASEFCARFRLSAPLEGYLTSIPVFLVTCPDPTLLGLSQLGRHR